MMTIIADLHGLWLFRDSFLFLSKKHHASLDEFRCYRGYFPDGVTGNLKFELLNTNEDNAVLKR